MQNTTSTLRDPLGVPAIESGASGIAWSAILGGAFVAIAVSIALMVLGSGLGLSFSSPLRAGHSAVEITSAVIIWLIVTQWISSAFGGYLAGRLRTKYGTLHTDEVFFRDTAHGFLAWAVATVVTVSFFASSFFSGIAGGAHMMGHMAPPPPPPYAMEHGISGPGGDPMQGNSMYVMDALFRPGNPAAAPGIPPQNAAAPGSPPANPPGIMPPPGPEPLGSAPQMRQESLRIMLNGIKNGDVSPSDRAYLSQMVAVHANITPAEADKRVNDAIDQMKSDRQKALQAADTARKTAATISIFTFLSLIIGAFVASVAGALGGKHRDVY